MQAKNSRAKRMLTQAIAGPAVGANRQGVGFVNEFLPGDVDTEIVISGTIMLPY